MQEYDEYESFAKKIKRKYDESTRYNPPVSLEDLEGTYVDEFKNVTKQLPSPFKELILKNSNQIKFAKINAVSGSRINSKKGIFVNFKEDISNKKGSWTSVFHEMGHAIDQIYGRISYDDAFGMALRSDFEVFTKQYALAYNISNGTDLYEIISKKLEDAEIRDSHVLSDLFGGMTENKCVGKTHHKSEYWKNEYALEKEAFAHFFSASSLKYQDKLDVIQSVFPNAYDEFLRLIGGL